MSRDVAEEREVDGDVAGEKGELGWKSEVGGRGGGRVEVLEEGGALLGVDEVQD